MKIGDKVIYIGKLDFFQDGSIFTVSYVSDGFICISDISEYDGISPYPMWYSKDFRKLSDVRKNKLNRISKKS